MQIHKKCLFIGHKKINITNTLINRLTILIEELIVIHNVTIFLFGSKSEFNDLCHSIVTNLKDKYPYIVRINYTCKSEVCVLEKDRQRLEEIYSKALNKEIKLLGFEEEYEYRNKYKSGKADYIERNYSMIDDSDYCVFYYDENYTRESKYSKNNMIIRTPQSGTKLAYNYAIRKNKKIINAYINS